MIKLTLVRFIKNFSTRQLIIDLNKYLFHGIFFFALSFLYVYISNWIFSRYIDPTHYDFFSFWDKTQTLFSLLHYDDFILQVYMFFHFHIYFLYILKYKQNTEEGFTSSTDQKSLQFYFTGIFILLLTTVFLGNGVHYFFSPLYYEFGLSSGARDFIFWLNNTLDILLPFISLYVCIVMLNKRFELTRTQNFWSYIGSLFLILLPVWAVINLSIQVLTNFLISPLSLVLQQSLVSIVITAFATLFISMFKLLIFCDLFHVVTGFSKKEVKSESVEVLD